MSVSSIPYRVATERQGAFLETDRGTRARFPLGPALDVIREMLAGLDELPTEGQRYTMTKIVAFVREHIRGSGLPASFRNAASLAELLGHLTLESKRLMPDADHFNHRAGILVDLLELVSHNATA